MVGNGFDLHHKIRSSYADFKDWLQYRHPMLYKELLLIYGKQVTEGEWWKDFENNLGMLDVVQFYEKCHKEMPQELFEKQNSSSCGLFHSPTWHPAANRLSSLYFILDAVMRQWLNEVSTTIYPSSVIDFSTKVSSFFITFNYTCVLEHPYQIPKEQILHIHGCLEDGGELIFGHGNTWLFLEHQFDKSGQSKPDTNDMQEIELSFNSKMKNPTEYMLRHNDIFYSNILNSVQDVIVYGMSFSDLDMPYVNQIHSKAPNALWTIYYHEDNDNKKILTRLNNNWGNFSSSIKFIQW